MAWSCSTIGASRCCASRPLRSSSSRAALPLSTVASTCSMSTNPTFTGSVVAADAPTEHQAEGKQNQGSLDLHVPSTPLDVRPIGDVDIDFDPLEVLLSIPTTELDPQATDRELEDGALLRARAGRSEIRAPAATGRTGRTTGHQRPYRSATGWRRTAASPSAKALPASRNPMPSRPISSEIGKRYSKLLLM